MTTHTLINGQAVDCVDAADRGLQYGDGLFETIAVIDGQPRYWQRHMARLQAGCVRLGLPVPDLQRLRFETDHLVQHHARCVLKILLTRGVGGRGYRPDDSAGVTRVLRRLDWPDVTLNGLRVMPCNSVLGRNPQLAGIKHLNRLEQVLASRELVAKQVDEGLLADNEGAVIEGTRSNLFLVKAGVVITPALTHAGVAGVQRAAVIDVCKANDIEYRICPVDWAAVEEAEECFMSNSLMGIQPVIEWEGKPRPAGPVTQRVQQLIAAAPEGEDWHP